MHPTHNLDAYIARLLFDYDCVIVPQLGGFVTNYRPAKFDDDMGIAYPPNKEVRFNKNLTKSDGLLTKAMADAMGLSFREADDRIRESVENCVNRLEMGKRVTFRKIGLLYFDEHKTLRFSPSEEVNFLKDAVGFTSFALPEPLDNIVPLRETLPGDDSTLQEPEKPHIPVRPVYSRSIYRVAAATLLPFIGFSLYLGLKTDFKSPAELSLADLWPLHVNSDPLPSVEPHYSPREGQPHLDGDLKAEPTRFPKNTKVFSYSFTDNAVDSQGVPVNLSKTGIGKSVSGLDGNKMAAEKSDDPGPKAKAVGAKQAKAAPSESNTETADKDVHGLYHIIGGCFGERQNADKYVAGLQDKGYPAAILDLHKGLYRVRLRSFDDYQTALGELKALRNKKPFSGAWMLKKKTS